MSEIIDELLIDAGERMAKSVESTSHEFASVRTGRASPSLLDRVVVDGQIDDGLPEEVDLTGPRRVSE